MINTPRYHAISRLLHWLMALAIFAMIAVGWLMHELPREDPNKFLLIGWHKAAGFALLLLAVARLAWSRVKPAPALPTAFKPLERKLHAATKHLLYLAMILVPLSGWAMSNFAGRAIKYGDLAVPLLGGKNDTLASLAHEAHEILPWVLLALVVLHLTAVIYHKLEGGEKDVLGRML